LINLFVIFVETNYLNVDMRKFESSHKEESRVSPVSWFLKSLQQT